MKRAIVTPAVLAPAALAELKDWLGITTPGDDAQLLALLRAALELCEDFTGTMPLQQDCEQILPVTPQWQGLRSCPVHAITAVLGIPAEGARFALPVANYEIDITADGAGRIRIANSGAAGRVAVRFTAGLAVTWENLPESLRHGVLRLAAFQFRQREEASAAAMPPAAIAALWRPWRQVRLA